MWLRREAGRTVSPDLVARVLVPGAIAAMLAGSAWSAVIYYSTNPLKPREAVLSDLQSADSNPHGWLPAAAGTALCGVLLLPAASTLREGLGRTRRRLAAAGAWLYRGGLVASIVMCVLEPFQELYSAAHIVLAFATFVGLMAGLTVWALAAASERLGGRRAGWIVLAATHVLAVLMLFEIVPPPAHGRKDFLGSLAARELALSVLIAGTTAALALGLGSQSRERRAAGGAE